MALRQSAEAGLDVLWPVALLLPCLQAWVCGNGGRTSRRLARVFLHYR